MPGFNLRSSAQLSKENENYKHDNLKHTEYFKNDSISLSAQTPTTYPIEFIDFSDRYKICFEGMIYNIDFKDELPKLISFVEEKNEVEIATLTSGWDGEFVFVIIDLEQNNCHIINDSWGRLPVYYWAQNGQFVVTRNISYITQNVELEYDQESLGVSILLGLTLGQDTIWKKVYRVPPHSCITYNLTDNKIEGGSFFDIRTVSGEMKLEEMQDHIKAKFEESLASRLEKMHNPTLSLSGGLDSRLIAAGITDNSIPFITYNRTNGVDHLDLDSSKHIIDKLDSSSQHEVITIEDTKIEDTDELLNFKQGINDLSMSYILPYYRLHEDRDISTITGDGGGKFFVDLYPLKNLNSQKSLIGYLLRYNATCSIETAAKLANVSPKAIENRLVEAIKSYPFASYNDKYAYYLIREAGINWAFEGEDRNRQYVWSSTPFYHPELIKMCLALPQRAKEYGQLYKYLYTQFPGALQDVSNPNWKEVVEDSNSVKRIHKRQKLKSILPTFLLDKKKGNTIESFEFSEELKTLMNDWEHSDILNLSTVKDKNSINHYWQLFTLGKLINSNS